MLSGRSNRRVRCSHRRGLRFEQLEDRRVLAAVALSIEIENLSPPGGLYETPFWVGVHDGQFDIGSPGEPATEFVGLEALAEEGDTAELSQRFQRTVNGVDATITAPGGFPGAPVFDPEETVKAELLVEDSRRQRFFSFASMVIPSNDAFFANLAQRAYPLFTPFGRFTGPFSIDLFGRDVYDAGTEVNDPRAGAAFSTEGGDSRTEDGVIQRHQGLGNFVGTGLPTGETLQSVFDPQTPLARITISLASNPSPPVDRLGPEATLRATPVTEAGGDSHEIKVIYTDPSGIDVSSLDPTDLWIFRFNAHGHRLFLQPTAVESDAADGTQPRTVVARYRVPAPGGSWGPEDNGRYNVYLTTRQVLDPLGNGNAFQRLGDFEVDIAREPVKLQITVENLSPTGGLFATPLWVGVHDGDFDIGTATRSAAQFPGLEELAEEGDTSAISERFQQGNGVDATIVSPAGFPGAPVFDPGETVDFELQVDNPRQQRYFSFATMVIPSNDAFLANLSRRAYPLFSSAGGFVRPLTIDLLGRDVYDAGTEVNNPRGGAAFSTEGGDSQDENGLIRPHPGLADFVGTGLPTGEPLQSAFLPQTPLMRITVSLASDPSPPSDRRGPEASLQADDSTAGGGSSLDFDVIYSDPSGVKVATIDPTDLRIVRFGAPGRGLSLHPIAVNTDAEDGSNPRTVVATYRMPAPGRTLGPEDNGRYHVLLPGGQVDDTVGNPNSFQRLGSFEVTIAVAPVKLDVTIENLSPTGGLFNTPFWVGVHDGSFDIGSLGESAAAFPGLEPLAEDGDTKPLSERFANTANGVDATIVAPEGFPGAPVFDPGETVSHELQVDDPLQQRYFSFASMVIPSNDAFLANLRQRAYPLFNLWGGFVRPFSIDLYGRDVYDAGTEVNNPQGGAAFSTAGGTGLDENGVIHPHQGLDEFIGTGLPTDAALQSAFLPQTPLARITVSLASNPSLPIDHRGPEATLRAETLTEGGGQFYELDVIYTDPSGVDVASLGPTDLRIIRYNPTVGLRGQVFLQPTEVKTDAADGTNPRTVVATYRIPAPGGSFGPEDNGRYQVLLNGHEVSDTAGNSSRLQRLGGFGVDIAPPPVKLQITVENRSPGGGLYLTPFWVGVHDGRFDLGSPGRPAAAFPGLELLAEEGDTSQVSEFFQDTANGVDATIVAAGGFPGAPVFDPGETVDFELEVENPREHRYFSFASMVIPSNDAFLGNLTRQAHRIFNRAGDFVGPVTINLFGRDVYDAGTEVNNPRGGAAFSTEGGDSQDENRAIHRHRGLNAFVGTGLPTGQNLQSAFRSATPLATITIRKVE